MHHLTGTTEPESALSQVLTLNSGKKKGKVLEQELSVNSREKYQMSFKDEAYWQQQLQNLLILCKRRTENLELGIAAVLIMLTYRGLNPEIHSLEFEASLGYICVWDW